MEEDGVKDDGNICGCWIKFNKIGTVRNHRFYSYFPGNNVLVDKETFELLAGCPSSVIPSGVRKIGGLAFRGCNSLKRIEIPASVTSIDAGAFKFCKNLETLTFSPQTQIKDIGEEAFAGCISLYNIILPPEKKRIRDIIQYQVASGILEALFAYDSEVNYQKKIYDDHHFSIFTESGQFGIKDKNDRVIVPPKYSHITLSDDGNYASIENENHLHGLYDIIRRKEIIPCLYDYLYPIISCEGGYDCNTFFDDSIRNNYVFVEKNSKSGVIDKDGNIIVPLKYDEIEQTFSGCLYCGRPAYVDVYNEGQLKAEVSCDSYYPNIEKFCGIVRNGKHGAIDDNGTIIIPVQYDERLPNVRDELYSFYVDEDYPQSEIIVKNNGKYGLVSITGKTLLPCDYDYISQGFLYDEIKKSYTRLLFQGELLFDKNEISYAYIAYNDELNFNGKWGLFYRNGEFVRATECLVVSDGKPEISVFKRTIEAAENSR